MARLLDRGEIMTDIVERLRHGVNRHYGKDPAGLLSESADEIEKLREVNIIQAKWLYNEKLAHKKLRDKVREWIRNDMAN